MTNSNLWEREFWLTVPEGNSTMAEEREHKTGRTHLQPQTLREEKMGVVPG